MSEKQTNSSPAKDRQRRQAEALRANLRRRKQQTRARISKEALVESTDDSRLSKS